MNSFCFNIVVDMFQQLIFGMCQVIKMYAWEKFFERKVTKIRDDELACMRKAALLNALANTMCLLTPYLVSTMVTESPRGPLSLCPFVCLSVCRHRTTSFCFTDRNACYQSQDVYGLRTCPMSIVKTDPSHSYRMGLIVATYRGDTIFIRRYFESEKV